MSRKADLAIEDVQGWTSLHFASQAGNLATVQMLLELGGQELCGIKNVAGEVASRVAFKWGKTEVVELIASFEQWWRQEEDGEDHFAGEGQAAAQPNAAPAQATYGASSGEYEYAY